MFSKLSTSTYLSHRRTIFCMTIVMLLLMAGFASAQDVELLQQGPSGQAQGSVGKAPAPTFVEATSFSSPPMRTPTELRELELRMQNANRPGPVQYAPPAPAGLNPGPGQPSPYSIGAAALTPSTFKIYRNKNIPATGISGGYAYVSGTAHEPSIGVNGKNTFQTGNWYASKSTDNGKTWSFLDPFNIFGTDLGGFCCDQVTQYEGGRNLQFWLLQFGTGLKLAISPGGNLFQSWCYYNIDATWFAQPSTTAIDYNEMAIGRNFIYITSNLFPSTGGSGAGILRLPIDSLATCSGFSYDRYAWVPPNWSFSWVPVLGADQGTMYWGSNWNYDLAAGSTFRVFSWPEDGTISWYDRTIDAFTFMYRNSGQNCASADGVVKNWCQYNDSRVKGGALGKNILYFSFDAKQDATFPFPYGRIVSFDPDAGMSYLGASNLYGTWGAIQYLDLAPNHRGDLAMVAAFGGGASGGTDYYPGTLAVIKDDFSPNQPWNVNFFQYGDGNPCTYGGLYRWGDYLSVRSDNPQEELWAATGFAIKGANCGTTGWYSQPRNIIFGRGRDQGSYNRWQAK